jgi:hypothetical protein
VDLPPADGPLAPAVRLWAGLDKSWQEAFRQAWEALRSGNIAVGACACTPDGEIVGSARNRVTDTEGPPGEIFGSSLTFTLGQARAWRRRGAEEAAWNC